MHIITLDCLPRGGRGVIAALGVSGGMRRRLQDMGMIRGTNVECVGVSPLGDPAAYQVRDAVIALRKEDARAIDVMIRENEQEG